MPRPWTILNTAYLFRRWWMNVRVDHVRLPSGHEFPEFHVVEYPDWTATLCCTEDDRFVLVEQYRHGLGRASLELPSGVMDSDESPLDGARRELLEETGYASDDWTSLGRCAPEPSKHTNHAHLFVARGARKIADPAPDPGEELHVHILTRDELLDAVSSEKMVHGIHLAALWMASSKGLF